MTYNSIYFVWFFIAFLGLYFLAPKLWMKQPVILLGNVVFYFYAGGPLCLLIVIGTSVIAYFISRWMEKVYQGFEKEKGDKALKEQTALLAGYKKRCKKVLMLGLFLILGILCYVKIGKLFHFEEVTSIAKLRFGTIIVPLGISYYTFSTVGYLLDIYWRKITCEHNYFKLLICMTFFPITIQGPISKYEKLLKQFDNLPQFDYERVCYGLQLMLWGYFKKIIVADRLTLYVQTIFSSVKSYAGVEIAVAVLFNVLAIYADFSGCMDIVCGVAQTMGITLEQNFRQPFFSRSAAEFWRRWHITLGTWFKDYVYMPIAMGPRFMKFGFRIRKRFGNRAAQIVSSSVPLAVVWVLTGLWHGTGADYLVWGCYWGILIIFGTVFSKEFTKITEVLHINVNTFGYRLFQMIRTFLLFSIGRMLTATGSLTGFVQIVKRLFVKSKMWVLFDGTIYTYGLDEKNFRIALLGILAIWLVDILQQKYSLRKTIAKQPLILRWLIYYGAIIFVLIYGIWGPAYDVTSFMYGGF